MDLKKMGEIVAEEEIQGPVGVYYQEKISVLVRIRPLNAKEKANEDASDWECVNGRTIKYSHNLPVSERSMYPNAYSFDRVFSPDCSTRQVYQEGVMKVALSVMSGINTSVFAYGQTCSGKTYTMNGVTRYAVADIYDYIFKHKEREFVMTFSAMEIYNESVKDLLAPDSAPLRLLDDPERGTVVEKLTEETLRDWNHFQELLSICEDQRQIGETSMNDTSSRSHQILKLTVESSAREFSGSDELRSLSATANFVDLAGSERASQTLLAGTRLKEGCHINRSLLTLGTVIRKLSKGRNGHIPFRDSKLTRILQSSLGGQARAAIICTMSPARSQVEQSRNTLLFASCAKEVATNARVNVVISDRALVKQLQRELLRLEDELKTSRAVSIPEGVDELLREKDLEIEKLKEDMIELKQQRDIAYMELAAKESFLEERPPKIQVDLEHSYPRLRVRNSPDDSPVTGSPDSEEGFLVPDYKLKMIRVRSSRLSPTTPNFDVLLREENDELDDEDFEDLCKEVRCIDSEYAAAESEEALNKVAPCVDDEVSSEVSCAASNLARFNPESQEIEIDESSTLATVLEYTDVNNEEVMKNVDPCTDAKGFGNKVSCDASNLTGSMPKSPEIKIDASSASEPATILEQTEVTNEEALKEVASSSEVSCAASNLAGSKPESHEKENDHAPSTSETDLEHAAVKNQNLLNEGAPWVDHQGLSEVSCGESNPVISNPKTQGIEFNAPSDPEKIAASKENKEREEIIHSFLNPIRERPTSQNLDHEVGSSYRSLRLVRSRSCVGRFEGVQNTPTTSTAWDHMNSNGRQESLHTEVPTLKHDRVNEVLTTTRTNSSSKSNNDTQEMTIQAAGTSTGLEPSVSDTNDAPDLLDKKQLIEEKVQATNLEPILQHALLESDSFDPVKQYLGSPTKWPSVYKKLQKEIIELWHACNISLVHRTYFFLLFKGDPKDYIYMEVEHRRLSFLKDIFAKGDQTMDNGHTLTLASSARAIRHERHMLSHKMKKKLSKEERENIFLRWGIGLNTKHRRSQLALRLWTNTKDMDHVAESATIVSKLVHFVDEEKSFKEMFGLSFAPRQRVNKKHLSLKRSVKFADSKNWWNVKM